jgi:signal transduction histidine kinase
VSNPSLLLLDTSGEADAALMALFDAQFCVLRATSLAAAHALLGQAPVVALAALWPQPQLALADVDALRAKHPSVTLWLVYDGAEPPQVLAADKVYACRRDDAPSMAALIARLARAEGVLERAQHQLYANAGAIALSGVIGGVAHDINNALTVVVGNGELLPPQESIEDQQGVEQIIASAQRAQAMLHTVLMLASDEGPQRHWSDARLMITNVVELVQSVLRRRKIQLQLDLAPDLPPVWGEIAQLQQVLLHLLHNAVAALQSTNGERRLLLRGYCSHTADCENICIELNDNGPGVADGLGERVFEPFVTTQPLGAGAGLGLTVARAIVARAHGSLELLPGGSGASFRITLPLRYPGAQRP